MLRLVYVNALDGAGGSLLSNLRKVAVLVIYGQIRENARIENLLALVSSYDSVQREVESQRIVQAAHSVLSIECIGWRA